MIDCGGLIRNSFGSDGTHSGRHVMARHMQGKDVCTIKTRGLIGLRTLLRCVACIFIDPDTADEYDQLST